MQEQFAEKFPETHVSHRSAVRTLIEKFRETLSVLNAELSGRPSKLNDKKCIDYDSILRAQSCIDARGHHFPTPFVSAQRLSERTVL
jgi:transposase